MSKTAPKTPITIKSILLDNNNWWNYYLKNKDTIRPAVMRNIINVMSCKRRCRGFSTYRCSNHECGHAKIVPFTCGGRSCTSCGYKHTQAWVAKQMEILPKTKWQHITLTIPDVFWGLFWANRWMLNEIMKIGADILQSIADERGIKIGIFMALHTFGKDLKRNVHLHISVTCGGVTLNGQKWKSLYFAQPAVMMRWRYAVLAWLKVCATRADFTPLPSGIENVTPKTALAFQLESYRKRYWHIHLQTPSNSHARNVEYLGRYVKRPPIAESKLRHYEGKNVTFLFLNRETNRHETKTLAVNGFLDRFTDHIPDANFRMIRYYGFLANSIRKIWLPVVRELLNLPEPIKVKGPSWDVIQHESFGLDPLACILCGSEMRLSKLTFCYSIGELHEFHYELAHRKWIAC